ncbi:alpha/beta fold hydrolase [Chloroflexales bacterium ZM16-3]|nr:alpha/beta fold hydrolase [Chloroflexales bacterium ZM16-3]
MSIADTDTTTEQRYSVSEHSLAGEFGQTRYWASQPQHGLPVVFIHGYAAMIEHWRRIIRPVAREHTFYALDLYGFGQSARPTGTPTRERWAKQVADFIREVVGGPAVIVGHSMGGVVAVEVARRYPELTRGLVLVNSSGMQMSERPPSQFDMVMMSAIAAPLLGETVAGLFTNPLSVDWSIRQGLMSAYHRKERVTDELVETFSAPLRRYGAASYLAVSRNFQGLIIDAKAGEITAPSLLIWGAEDRSIPPSDAEAIKRRVLPQADLAILPGTGHCPFDETPELFCDALLPWLGRL